MRLFCYTILPKGPNGANIALGLHLLNGKTVGSHFGVNILILLCKGIAFSALWGAGVVQADELAPPSLQATSQGMLNLFCDAILTLKALAL